MAADPDAGRLRHDEPRVQPRADRLGARLPGSRTAIASTLTFDDERARRTCSRRCRRRDGNATTGGIVLSGHTDVVPVDGQPWDTNPFAATRIGDRLYGRGVTDMKSFSATGLAFVPGVPAPRPRAPAALRAVLRRGGRLHRRAPAASRTSSQRGVSACGLHRRRADRHGARRRAQGQEELALPRARARGAFVAHAARRQRGADRVRDRHLPDQHGARASATTADSTTRTTFRTRRSTPA